MRAKSPNILVVVFDGARARFFNRDRAGWLAPLSEVESGLHRYTHDAVSDRQGRGFASSGSGTRHAYEAKHDKHKQEKHDFVHMIVAALDTAYDQRKFDRLAIVAPERSLGEFRTLASDKLKALIWREVPKEFTKYSAHELEERLRPYFAPEEEEIIEPRKSKIKTDGLTRVISHPRARPRRPEVSPSKVQRHGESLT